MHHRRSRSGEAIPLERIDEDPLDWRDLQTLLRAGEMARERRLEAGRRRQRELLEEQRRANRRMIITAVACALLAVVVLVPFIIWWQQMPRYAKLSLS